MALFNCKQYFADSDTVLSVNYDVVKNEGVLHSEYELSLAEETLISDILFRECTQNLWIV